MKEKKVKSDPSLAPKEAEDQSVQCGSLDEGTQSSYRRKTELTQQRKAKALKSQYSKKRLLDY
jgi:hypothetical protein